MGGVPTVFIPRDYESVKKIFGQGYVKSGIYPILRTRFFEKMCFRGRVYVEVGQKRVQSQGEIFPVLGVLRGSSETLAQFHPDTKNSVSIAFLGGVSPNKIFFRRSGSISLVR